MWGVCWCPSGWKWKQDCLGFEVSLGYIAKLSESKKTKTKTREREKLGLEGALTQLA